MIRSSLSFQFFQTENPDYGLPPDETTKLDPTLPETVVNNCMRYIQILHESAEEVQRAMILPMSDEVEQDASAGMDISEFERGLGRLDVMEKAKVPVHLRVPM